MGLKEAIIELNSIKQEGIIADYAIGGGYAVMYHSIELSTYDLDVFILLEREEDYGRIFEYFKNKGTHVENIYIYIESMPVQFLPSYISPLCENAVKEAQHTHIEGVPCRLIGIEYLMLLLLTSYRPKDILRIEKLSEKANNKKLDILFRRFDDEKKTLFERYKKVLG